jgi:single-stranded-DNA-specific exonuclease
LLPAVDERRWLLPTPLGGDGPAVATRDPGGQLPDELLVLLRRRGLLTPEAVRELLEPDPAPDPDAHFPDLAPAVERLVRCCQTGEMVAICGDYDADGMTSTALLVGVLQRLGARPQAAIPSRMDDGYGLNAAMVERLAAEGVRLLITVDNGVAAIEALQRAAALDVEVILTDHHTLPPQLPPHLALLHPAVTPEASPYRGLAGVGLAHVLATALCRRLKNRQGLEIALNLFCIGTIADMAPLQGVNRRWLLDGLPLLGGSPLPGLQALRQLAGLEKNRVDAEAVGFQLAPRINAVGRLGDPQLVVDLLTTEDPERALELARSCEALNRQRRELCGAIEAEALALLEADGPRRPAFLLLAQGHWHHGVIGIVASRLVERFGRPVALLAAEGGGRLRASVRAPKGFAVDGALTACADLLERHGGHPAAGGFTVRAENVAALQERLDALACTWLEAAGDGRTVEPEALLRLERIDREFWHHLQRLAPFGIGHPTPLFWTSRCQVVEQKVLRGGHLQLQLAQGQARLRAIAWRWQGPSQWPGPVDVAFRLRRDDWQGVERFQLELEAIRCSGGDGVVLQRRDRTYWCRRQGDTLVITNVAGEELRTAIHPDSGALASAADPPHPYVQGLLREAAMALGMAEG